MVFIISDVGEIRDFIFVKGKVQSSEIQVNVARILGPWNHCNVHMNRPAKNNLRWNKLVMAGDLQDQRRMKNRVFLQTVEVNPLGTCREEICA